LSKIKTLAKSAKPPKPEFAVVFCLENQGLESLAYVNAAVKDAAAAEKFKAGKDKTLYLPAGNGSGRVLLYGLGKVADLDLEGMRRAACAAARKARDLKAAAVVMALPLDQPKGISEAELAKAAAEGIWLGLYKFTAYKSKPKDGDESKDPALFSLLCSSESRAKAAAKSVDEAQAVCAAVCDVRDMINTPPNDFNPQVAAKRAARIAKIGKHLSLKVLQAPQIKAMGMGGVTAVGQGSISPPVFVHLHYRPARAKKTVALVGKGVTFDSGGLSIKGASYMGDMKSDMSGGATVLGITLAASRLGLGVEIHAIAPFVENMPGGRAFRVDDVVTFLNGKTAEIMNTDAEGRLILADALVYASRLKPDLILDFATLTGAAIVALGMNITALMGDDTTIEKLKAAGERCGEMMWQLPLPKSYRSHIDSRIADMKNTGNSGEAGTISAALFLKEFVAEGLPWVHCDIAGPAFLKKEEGVHPSGATGSPLRSIIEFLKTF
jgi:leucyl aminopeptidase